MRDDPRAAERSAQRPASHPLPDATTASERPSADGRGEAHAEPRTPDEYLETPGSHRRSDGAATDVGA